MLFRSYTANGFVPHAALLRHPFGCCARFLHAKPRRAVDHISVPLWPVILSDRLPVVALVGHYPTNKLIGRRPLPQRPCGLSSPFDRGSHAVLAHLSAGYSPQRGRSPTCHAPGRHSTRPKPDLVRLALVRHAASVYPEPGSNSPKQLDSP